MTSSTTPPHEEVISDPQHKCLSNRREVLCCFHLGTVFSYMITLRTELQLLRMILHTEEESHKFSEEPPISIFKAVEVICFEDIQTEDLRTLP
jgi:hypothetical protein